MHQTLKLDNEQIDYVKKISTRARHMRIAIHPGGAIVVTVPKVHSQFFVEKFLRQKSEWILAKARVQKLLPAKRSRKQEREEFLVCKDRALALAEQRLDYFNKHYGYTWKKISIKNQKTRWGSCSRRGTLNFNYKIALVPQEMADYVIVHELCHLGEFNHSRAFWALVARTIPDYKNIRAALKKSSGFI